ncbi:MAG: glycogen debranching protein [Gammaproteobacteria bacterium HGW-Gammaproteobacteria-10]|nr:MAG: glycogen debranching protein [Gammaproteobacteria bacterium HGW-Gammaproteobacteria-10]
MTQIKLEAGNCKIFEQAVEYEWLITNGIGGFASGTVCEANTRRYHGLLVAAFAPPAVRILLVAKLEITIRYRGREYPLFCNEFADGTVAPKGYVQLESFHLDNGLPVWRYAVADAVIEKRIVMKPGQNTTYVNIQVLRASDKLAVELMPLCTYRDYHSHSHSGWDLSVREIAQGFEINAFAGACAYRLSCEQATFIPDPAWYWNFKHRAETARGLDDSEDLFRPGRFILSLGEGEQATVVISDKLSITDDFTTVQQQLCVQQLTVLQTLPTDAPGWIKQLALAAGQFIVDHYQHGLPAGKTVIAGYPWFADWGRDTMIALPGLTLALGRFDIAAEILRTFAAHVSDGMLPNRFPDNGAEPEYNTVDATLWYFHAIDQYTQMSGDPSLAEELYPVLADIIDWHRRGTRYGIKVDLNDGLLAAGEDGVQLTWMDAKVDDWVVTPRIGKCVEINALWYNALKIMTGFAGQLGHTLQARDYQTAATQVKKSFQRFWNPDKSCLYDVIDAAEGDQRGCDSRLRPNQVFAVSLPYSPLSAEQQKSVVDSCARELLTSFGLRSLGRGEPGYASYYQGNPAQRDSTYHQGTVWAWLLGPFVDAHFRVYQDAEQARSFLEPLGLHLTDACIGQVSEIFDAEPPFKPRGCFAQAWSVSEILRAWLKLKS